MRLAFLKVESCNTVLKAVRGAVATIFSFSLYPFLPYCSVITQLLCSGFTLSFLTKHLIVIATDVLVKITGITLVLRWLTK